MTITRQDNLLILHPDVLVSSTKVADTSSCARRALLQEIIRTSPQSLATVSTDAGAKAAAGYSSPALVYGNLLHEVMQRSLTTGDWSEQVREQVVEEVLTREVESLYDAKLSEGQAKTVMLEKSRGFSGFAETYCGPQMSVSDPLLLPLARRAILRSTHDRETLSWRT